MRRDLEAFVARVAAEGGRLHRDFAWRRTRDPYAVLVSEVMLQQTQVTRVERYFAEWLAAFPTLEALAAAPLEAVLRAWQGLGYNRRAVALKRLAEQIVAACAGGAGPAALPRDETALRALPGIGPATAAGVRAFAFGESAAYLETNVRAVFLHELFADRDDVPDREVAPLVAEAARIAEECGIDPARWNWALLDYGAHLKRTLPNPSRRSRHHTRQSAFEGSSRQKRAWLLRAVLGEPGLTAEEYTEQLSVHERRAGRDAPAATEVADLLERLTAEETLAVRDGRYFVAES